MRWGLALALVGGCSFEHGALSTADAPSDTVDAFAPAWATDSTSKKGVPATCPEWGKVMAAAGLPSGPPSSLWLMQEVTGSLADSCNSVSLSPVNVQAGNYNLSVPGWTRHAVSTPEIIGDRGFGSSATGNLDGTSYLLLLYVDVANPPSPRSIAGLGNMSDHHYLTVSTSGAVGASSGTDGSPKAGVTSLGSTVHPVVMKIDVSHMSYVAYTDQERVAATWTTTSGQGNTVFLGSVSIGSAAIQYLYGAIWSGPKAELADGDIKKVLQTLGWTVTGY